MKHFRFYIVLLIFASCSRGVSGDFQDLDDALAKRNLYDAAYEAIQDSLRLKYRTAATDSVRWELARTLQQRLFYHDLDSCHRYSRLMLSNSGKSQRMKTISESYYAHCLFRMDSVSKAMRIFEGIAPENIPEEALDIYYNVGYHIFSSKESDKSKCRDIVRRWWQWDSTSVSPVFYRAQFSRMDGNPEDSAISGLLNAPLTSPNDTAKAYFYLAREFAREGDVSTAIRYYSESAMYDCRISAKAYSALYELSLLLFREGDVEKANHYMRTVLADTYSSHYGLHYEEVTNAMILIMDELVHQKDIRGSITLYSLLIVSLLFLISIYLLLYLKRQSRQLSLSHSREHELSKIKDAFLANYMESCVTYLNKIDDYRSSLKRAIKNEGLESVRTLLRKPSYAAEEFGALLEMFDMSFLGIFPDFVENVNAHMQPQWQLEQPAPGRLSMELRVLALIRMGITKSQRIARALNLSITTVYSYHYNLRKHSLHANEDFDAIIAGL